MESEDYNIAHCIEKKVIDMVGCRPQWIKDYKSQAPVCRTKQEYCKYTGIIFTFGKVDQITLEDKFGCLKPCRYMEYRVCTFGF